MLDFVGVARHHPGLHRNEWLVSCEQHERRDVGLAALRFPCILTRLIFWTLSCRLAIENNAGLPS